MTTDHLLVRLHRVRNPSITIETHDWNGHKHDSFLYLEIPSLGRRIRLDATKWEHKLVEGTNIVQITCIAEFTTDHLDAVSEPPTRCVIIEPPAKESTTMLEDD